VTVVRFTILLAGFLAFMVGLTLGTTASGHDQNVAAWSFILGVVLALLVPWLWRNFSPERLDAAKEKRHRPAP
jgi:hypothetical protein